MSASTSYPVNSIRSALTRHWLSSSAWPQSFHEVRPPQFPEEIEVTLKLFDTDSIQVNWYWPKHGKGMFRLQAPSVDVG
jgi:hypothetical protein